MEHAEQIAPAASMTSLVRKVGAEMVGTFALVFVGCGAVMVDQISSGAVSHVGVALAFGLVITVMIYATGHICGAHFNPAVTIAFALARRFPWRQVPAYLAGQFLAATLAAILLVAILGPVANVGATLPAGSATQSLAMEVVLTFFLMFVITAVATDSRAVGQMAGVAIGGTVALAAMFGGPISGASMNPARTLGPAIASGQFDSVWVYFVGPIVGAAAGAVVYELVFCGESRVRQGASGCC